MSIKGYRDLEVWQKAMDLVVHCYKAAEGWPRIEVYALCTQLRRACVSVPANIAEGQGRSHTREFLNHLSIAYGSLMEVETHLQIAHRLGYMTSDLLAQLLDKSSEVGRMMNGLMRALEQKLAKWSVRSGRWSVVRRAANRWSALERTTPNTANRPLTTDH